MDRFLSLQFCATDLAQSFDDCRKAARSKPPSTRSRVEAELAEDAKHSLKSQMAHTLIAGQARASVRAVEHVAGQALKDVGALVGRGSVTSSLTSVDVAKFEADNQVRFSSDIVFLFRSETEYFTHKILILNDYYLVQLRPDAAQVERQAGTHDIDTAALVADDIGGGADAGDPLPHEDVPVGLYTFYTAVVSTRACHC